MSKNKLLLGLLLTCSCSTKRLPPPMPLATYGPQRAPMFTAATAKEWVIPIQYPTNVVRTNYWWDLMVSTNLTTWRVKQTNVGPQDPVVYATNRHEFFKLQGRP